MILMRNVKQSQENVDLIARCKEIRKVILRECNTLRSVTVFPDEMQFYDTSQIEHTQSLQMPPAASYDTQRDIRHGVEDEGEDSKSGMGVGSEKKEVVKTVAALNCPSFRGLLIFNANKNESNEELSSGQQHSTSCSEQNSGTSSTDDAQVENLIFNTSVNQEISKVKAESLGVLDLNYSN